MGHGPRAIAAGTDGIWVANFLDGTVARIDPGTNAVVDTSSVGDAPTGLALAGGSVWVSDGADGSVARFEPQQGEVTFTPLGSEAADIAVAEDTLWVTVRGAEAAHRGGTLKVWAPGAFLDSLDPALAYRALTWNMLSLTNDGLVGYQRTGGLEANTLVPNLARSIPEPTDGGRTYTFQLRDGPRYSTGEPVRPEDLRRAIERVFANASDGAFYYSSIVGAPACERALGEPCDLSGGIDADSEAGTVTFHLRAPDPDFLHTLTLPFASAVPSVSPDALADDETLPATGPYLIAGYEPSVRVVLDRNPEFESWSQTARPDGFPDHIVWRLGSNSDRMVADTLEGGSDLVFQLPPAGIAELASAHAGQLHLSPRANTFFMSFNTQTPPFDDLDVRRALNFAVDRAEVESLSGGLFRATCQILPPSLPGYGSYCPYTRRPGGTWTAPDLTTARTLVDRSGTAGAEVVVWASEGAFPVSVPVGRYFRDLLEELGYRTRLEVVGPNEYFQVAVAFGRPQRAQIAFSGWTTDYAAPSGFIVPLFSCDGTSNATGFCDPDIDRRIEEAGRLQTSDPAGASDAWSEIEHALVDQAPWIPLGNAYWSNLASQRLGNFQSAASGGPLIDQMWVQ